MEKIRPIDAKLKYQIDRLVQRAATTSTNEDNNRSSLRPNPDELMIGSDEEEDETEGKTSKKSLSSNIYKLNKSHSVIYKV